MGENTGSIAIDEVAGRREAIEAAHVARMPTGPMLSKDTWVKIIIWFVPMVFMAGILYATFTATSERVDKHDDAIKEVQSTQNTIRQEQAIIRSDITSIKKAGEDRSDTLDAVDDRLRQQDVDLAVIREKLRVPRSDD